MGGQGGKEKKQAPPLGSAAEIWGGEGAALPRVALVPLTGVRADTVSAGGSVSRPLPRFDARRDASRLGLDLACGCRSEASWGCLGRLARNLYQTITPPEKMAPGPSWGLVFWNPACHHPPRPKTEHVGAGGCRCSSIRRRPQGNRDTAGTSGWLVAAPRWRGTRPDAAVAVASGFRLGAGHVRAWHGNRDHLRLMERRQALREGRT